MSLYAVKGPQLYHTTVWASTNENILAGTQARCYVSGVARAKKSKHAEVEVFVTLRVIDRVALTARRTLVERLGYGDILAGLERRDYYRLVVAGEEDEALTYARDMVENTAVFVNPTKESYVIEPVRRPLSEGGRYIALVYPREGLYDEVLCRFLALELGYDRVIAAGRGVAWTLRLAGEVGPEYVEEILLAARRTRGLLSNPHAEQYELA